MKLSQRLFVPMDLAKTLKKNGFFEACLGWWQRGKLCFYGRQGEEFDGYKLKEHLLAPTWQQAIDWLREEKKIVVEVSYKEKENGYYFSVYDGGNVWNHSEQTMEYYVAIETGIRFALARLATRDVQFKLDDVPYEVMQGKIFEVKKLIKEQNEIYASGSKGIFGKGK